MAKQVLILERVGWNEEGDAYDLTVYCQEEEICLTRSDTAENVLISYDDWQQLVHFVYHNRPALEEMPAADTTDANELLKRETLMALEKASRR